MLPQLLAAGVRPGWQGAPVPRAQAWRPQLGGRGGQPAARKAGGSQCRNGCCKLPCKDPAACTSRPPVALRSKKLAPTAMAAQQAVDAGG
eukprot:11875625-Alexandrium_andersonii.AAC.1